MRSTSDALLSVSCRHSPQVTDERSRQIHSFIHPPTTSATGALAGNGNNRIPLSSRLLVGGLQQVIQNTVMQRGVHRRVWIGEKKKTNPSVFACCTGEVRNNIQRKEEYSFLCVSNAVTGENQKNRNTSAPPVIIARNQWMNINWKGSHVVR